MIDHEEWDIVFVVIFVCTIILGIAIVLIL